MENASRQELHLWWKNEDLESTPKFLSVRICDKVVKDFVVPKPTWAHGLGVFVALFTRLELFCTIFSSNFRTPRHDQGI